MTFETLDDFVNYVCELSTKNPHNVEAKLWGVVAASATTQDAIDHLEERRSVFPAEVAAIIELIVTDYSNLFPELAAHYSS